MRISEIKIQNQPPIQKFEVEGLSDLVVIAGPNGVGKTRLATALLSGFRGHNAGVEMVIEATNTKELEAFGKKNVTTSNQKERQDMLKILQASKSRRNYQSGILYIESGRSIQKVQPLGFSFDFPDPYLELIPWDFAMRGLAGRWTDTQHAIFKKIQSQKTSIANRAIDLKSKGHEVMNLQFSDPLEPFKEAFAKLLGPKRLVRADLSAQTLIYEEGGEERQISTLSSGESEVLSITFDFILRNPNDCIIFFDEPEVHLHPELLIRMVATLRSIGRNNQFFFLSHSPDLVSSSLEDSVIFLTPKKSDTSNQAILVKSGDETTKAMHQLGHSVGVLSLGRRIVVIEGTDTSLDKKTYSQILNNKFPDLVLVPGGGRRSVENFGNLVSGVLDKAIWGVEFFLLTDRDAGETVSGSERVAQLPRYHLENYFLDSNILASCFEASEEEASWLRDPDQIENELGKLAMDNLGYAVALQVAHNFRQSCGNVDIMVAGAHDFDKDVLVGAIVEKVTGERSRIASELDIAAVRHFAEATYHKFSNSIDEGSSSWKINVPGKPIFKKFCALAKWQPGRVKNLYLNAAAADGNKVFQDIIEIFEKFSQAGTALTPSVEAIAAEDN